MAEFIKQTDNCVVIMFQKNTSMQMEEGVGL